jgi:hypothetical protein
VRRTARETLNELRWREGASLADAVLFVRDRLDPSGSKVILGSALTALGRRTFDTATTTIPYHRIVRIEYRGHVVFDRPEKATGAGQG